MNAGRSKVVMSKTLEQITQELDAKIPRDVVSERDGGGGRKLSYLEGWYVIDRLNQVFGPLNWSKEILDVRQVVNTTSRGEFPAYLVKVRLTVSATIGHVVKEAYGYGADKSSQNAHELAIKEAVTDALKVAAKDLGMSLGLALYDKTQEFVDDGEEKAPKASVERNAGPKTAASGPKAAGEPQGIKPGPAAAPQAPGSDVGKLKTVIRSHVKIAIQKGILSMEGMKKYLNEKYGPDNLDALKPEVLPEVLTYVQGLTK
jgi:DNA repair and recombination protein RAD52